MILKDNSIIQSLSKMLLLKFILKYFAILLHWRETKVILIKCRLISVQSTAVMALYYLLSVVTGVLDGVSMVVLVDVVVGRVGPTANSLVSDYIIRCLVFFSLPQTVNAIYFALVFLFILRLMSFFAINILDAHIGAFLRRKIQNEGFYQLLHGDWEFLREIRVGQRVGAVTEEAANVARFFTALIKLVYGIISVVVLIIMALLVSPGMSILFMIVVLPILFIFKFVINKQGNISKYITKERQGLYAKITENLTGLFQIKVEGDIDRHVESGLSNQEALTRLEIDFYYSIAYVYVLNMLFPVVILLSFYMWSTWKGQTLTESMHLLAGVGAIGSRAVSQVSNLFSSVAGLTGFSGSILPVYELFTVPAECSKKTIAENTVAVSMINVSYNYSGKSGITGVTLKAGIGTPLIIKGPSGAGKTTIANLIAGIYKPHLGKIWYTGESGRDYSALEYKPRVGYVTQDVHLFHGTIRDNLFSAGQATNGSVNDIWKYLRQAGAEGFVENLGGIDAEITEAGRSLSGGEKRRIGIARVLTKEPDILILDEVTSGLDAEMRSELIYTINNLSRQMVVIMITHEDINLESGELFTITGNIILNGHKNELEPKKFINLF